MHCYGSHPLLLPPRRHKQQMTTPDTLNFTGDITTFIGFAGVVSTAFILYTVFRSFAKSPLNK